MNFFEDYCGTKFTTKSNRKTQTLSRNANKCLVTSGFPINTVLSVKSLKIGWQRFKKSGSFVFGKKAEKI